MNIIKAIDKDQQKATLRLCPITVNDDYSKKWNESSKDFVLLTFNGEPIRDTLYRIGGLSSIRPNQDIKDNYFLILKHVEAFYDDNITKDVKSKPHLRDSWVIIDKNGVEKVEFKHFSSPYLVKDSVIYTIDRKYYNIETSELYCEAYHSMSSEKYLFLENKYDSDKSKRGVMKINKIDGTYEIFN